MVGDEIPLKNNEPRHSRNAELVFETNPLKLNKLRKSLLINFFSQQSQVIVFLIVAFLKPVTNRHASQFTH